MSFKSLSVVILAAGKGTRMYSELPKVLHRLAGKAMVQHVIDSVKKLNTQCIHLVYGFGRDQLQASLTDPCLNWVLQSEQLGTGHAVQQAAPHFNDNEDILILYGDVPLISVETLEILIQARPTGGIALLSAILDNPFGYGRIVRKQGEITGIIEQKDASPEQLRIKEINTGILVANGGDLKYWLSQLNNQNAQGEYYLTEIISLAHQQNRQIVAVQPNRLSEVEGVNNRLQLAALERVYQRDQADNLLLAGLMLRDPARFDLRGQLTHGQDVEIDINVILEGEITLGDKVTIGSGCVIKNSIIGDNCVISPYSVLDSVTMGQNCTIGPFARLRPRTKLADAVHIGNFVETKNASIDDCSKVGHLSYLGDSEIGKSVNVGAGTITCNYDGANKHLTRIGDHVFIGSDSQLIAPVQIASHATIAAGTTVREDVVDPALIYNPKPQQIKKGWVRTAKTKK